VYREGEVFSRVLGQVEGKLQILNFGSLPRVELDDFVKLDIQMEFYLLLDR
jgi:hypothetical protein